MLDHVAYPLRAHPVPGLPVAEMVIGATVEEAAALLPRLFNLCRVAQGIAARAAFGLDLQSGWQGELRSEIIRDHVLKLFIKWPGMFSLPPVKLPSDWQTDATGLRKAIFGADCGVPQDLEDWLAGGTGVAPLLSIIAMHFEEGECVRANLPFSSPETLFQGSLQENSVAGRQAGHRLMQEVEACHGRGPLWSALAVVLDLDALLEGDLPALQLSEGQAVVPAARGLYGIRAKAVKGRVTEFARITPTDHLTAPGGALAQALESLSADRAGQLAPVLLAILDPCFPVELEAADA